MVVGLQPSVLGLRSYVFGLRPSAFSLRSYVFGLRSSAVNLGSSVFCQRHLALIVVRHGVSLLSHDFYASDNTHSDFICLTSGHGPFLFLCLTWLRSTNIFSHLMHSNKRTCIDRSLAPRELAFAHSSMHLIRHS